MAKETYIKNNEMELKNKISFIFDGLIEEINNIPNWSHFSDANSQIKKIEKIGCELNETIIKTIKKSIFNFSKLLFSKDLRRNVSYFEILLKIQQISGYAIENAISIVELWSKNEVFNEEVHRKYITEVSKTLISLINELKLLILSEDTTLAEKILKDSKTFNKSVLEVLKSFNESFELSLSNDKKNVLLYKVFIVLRNFELISKDIDQISKLIIYIQTGII